VLETEVLRGLVGMDVVSTAWNEVGKLWHF
jgi:hypothetical protein